MCIQFIVTSVIITATADIIANILNCTLYTVLLYLPLNDHFDDIISNNIYLYMVIASNY